MKKTIFKFSVILVILPVSFGSSGNVGCNKEKQTSDKKTEVKQKDSVINDEKPKISEDKNCTFRLT